VDEEPMNAKRGRKPSVRQIPTETVESLVLAETEKFWVSREDILGMVRTGQAVRSRHRIWATLTMQGWTCSEIARAFCTWPEAVRSAMVLMRERAANLRADLAELERLGIQ
jgi:hypothetical protein